MAEDVVEKAAISWQRIANWTFTALIGALLYVWSGTVSDLKDEQRMNAGQANSIIRLEAQLEERRQSQTSTNVRIEQRLDDMNRKIERLLER